MREFYANARVDQNGYSVVRGMTVDYNLEAIRGIIGGEARRPDEDDWVLMSRESMDLGKIVRDLCVPGTEWKRNHTSNERLSFHASAMNRYARA